MTAATGWVVAGRVVVTRGTRWVVETEHPPAVWVDLAGTVGPGSAGTLGTARVAGAMGAAARATLGTTTTRARLGAGAGRH